MKQIDDQIAQAGVNKTDPDWRTKLPMPSVVKFKEDKEYLARMETNKGTILIRFMPDLAPMPELGVPSDVLMRRPDVRQSYRQIQAADQRLGVAIADQYPRISISASVETTSTTSVRDLFDDWLANLAGNAIQKLNSADVEKIFFTDSVPVPTDKLEKVEVCSVAQLLARAIDRIHRSESISILFESER